MIEGLDVSGIVSVLGMLLGGSGGAFFTWRYMNRKAKAEAVSAEISATKEMQDMYQQMLEDSKRDREDRKVQVEELRAERDHYKQDRNELRERLEKLENTMNTLREESVKYKNESDRKIDTLGRKVEGMRPFLCGDLKCKKRQLVALLENGESDKEGGTP